MPKKLATWQLWHAMKCHLGEGFLMKILGRRNGRTIRLYCQDPNFTEDRCKDPLQTLHLLFCELVVIGRGDVAKKAIAFLQTAIRPETEICAVEQLKDSMSAEILADFSAVEALRRAIDDGANLVDIKKRKDLAVEEIERTYAFALKES